MNKLINKLPLLAFVLAAFAAVAFTSPSEEVGTMYGYDGTDWYEVTGPPSPTTYACDAHTQPGCLYDAVGGNLVDPVTKRQFRNIGLDPIGD